MAGENDVQPNSLKSEERNSKGATPHRSVYTGFAAEGNGEEEVEEVAGSR